MRISSLLMLLAPTACGGVSGEAPAGERITCFLDGAKDEVEFAKNCTFERRTTGYVIHRPDGGFRRLDREFKPMDGADKATLTPLTEELLEVAVAGDRYWIPRADRPN